ncbi:ArsC/Spx/MgsR family protein [Winogradskyella maritima]|uniref:Arsenate reductase family protein n=1 Tax=Winogradskyella maritima TaxID=1517766 RepID=A0ABV8AHG6_9FLAO|nr:ArsC/Spx/MgsR family protein [Winogradskyella maritima]
MKKVYYLSTCDTCKRILNELDLPSNFSLQNIKTDAMTKAQIDEMAKLAGSYEALFSKRARLYKSLELKDKNLKEPDFKHYLLDHYTFLKRPVIINGDQIFVGNSKKTIAEAKTAIHES